MANCCVFLGRFQLLSILQAAGWPIIPLVFCSVLALALIFERLISLRTSQVVPPQLLDEVITVTRATLPTPDTISKLSANSTLGKVLAQGLSSAAQPKMAEADLRNAMEAAGKQAVFTLEKNLTTLGTIATAAPLLGLLGTVVGMIEIFGVSGSAASNPQELAHGISVALYNTAFGLVVAIPSLVAYRFFRARVDGFTVQLEHASEQIVPHLMRLSHNRR